MFQHFWEMCCLHLQGDWIGSNRCLCNRKEGREVVGIAASEGHRKEKSGYDLHWSNGNCKFQEWPQKNHSVSVTDQLSFNHSASPQPLKYPTKQIQTSWSWVQYIPPKYQNISLTHSVKRPKQGQSLQQPPAS